jgi:hypothetical protein
MDKALVFGTKDCRFESCQDHLFPVPGMPEMIYYFLASDACRRFILCEEVLRPGYAAGRSARPRLSLRAGEALNLGGGLMTEEPRVPNASLAVSSSGSA